MSNYAMILQNRVIDVLQNQFDKPYYPPDPSGNPVIAIQCDDTVELGMMYNSETNTFSEYIPPEPEPIPEPTPTQLDRIETSLSNTLEEIRAEARDAYTLSLIENGII